MSRPRVSVAMISYRHRPFIAAALDGVLAQRRDFPIEIVISDDCSPDGTGAEIDRYQAAHASLFVRRDPPANVGMNQNFGRVWSACRGEYIAVLEGDDFWHDPEKLALQVAFMDSHPECTMSAHRCRVLVTEQGSEGRLAGEFPAGPLPETLGFAELVRGNVFHTCSVMFRAGVVAVLPDWLNELALGDWPLTLLHSAQGPAGFMDRTLATYRVHPGGAWSTSTREQQVSRTAQALEGLREALPTRRSDIDAVLAPLYYEASKYGVALQDRAVARRLLRASLARHWQSRRLDIDLLLRSLFCLALPRWSGARRARQ